MERIGAKNVLVARIVCLVVGLFVAGLVGVLSSLLIEAAMEFEPESAAAHFSELSADVRCVKMTGEHPLEGTSEGIEAVADMALTAPFYTHPPTSDNVPKVLRLNNLRR